MNDPDDTPELAGEDTPRGKPMGFFDHLEELRGTLTKSAVAFLICAILVGVFLRRFNDALMWPLRQVAAENPGMSTELTSISIMEVFNVVIQMCLAGGLLLAAPFIVYFVGQFVAPALTEKETKVIVPTGLSALVLFASGACFSFFFLVPSTLRVAIAMNKFFGWEFNPTPASYFSILIWLVLGMGAAFEFPLIIVMLVWLGVLTTAFLRKYRRHAIVIIFVLSAIITPTSDPVTQTYVAAPLYFLYEIAILVGSRVERHRVAKDAAAAAA